MTRLVDVLDIKTIDKIFVHCKEAKKYYTRADNPSYSNLIFDLEKDRVMEIIVKDIPLTIQFNGQDLVNYMRHLAYCFECTNGWKLYLQRQYRK